MARNVAAAGQRRWRTSPAFRPARPRSRSLLLAGGHAAGPHIGCAGNVPGPADDAIKAIGQHINDALDPRGWYELGQLGCISGQRRFAGVDGLRAGRPSF